MNLVLSRAAVICAIFTVSSGALAAGKKTSDPAPHHARASSKAAAKKHTGKSHHKHAAKAAKGSDAKTAGAAKASDNAASEEVAP